MINWLSNCNDAARLCAIRDDSRPLISSKKSLRQIDTNKRRVQIRWICPFTLFANLIWIENCKFWTVTNHESCIVWPHHKRAIVQIFIRVNATHSFSSFISYRCTHARTAERVEVKKYGTNRSYIWKGFNSNEAHVANWPI